jgi:hypothetical protein
VFSSPSLTPFFFLISHLCSWFRQTQSKKAVTQNDAMLKAAREAAKLINEQNKLRDLLEDYKRRLNERLVGLADLLRGSLLFLSRVCLLTFVRCVYVSLFFFFFLLLLLLASFASS